MTIFHAPITVCYIQRLYRKIYHHVLTLLHMHLYTSKITGYILKQILWHVSILPDTLKCRHVLYINVIYRKLCLINESLLVILDFYMLILIRKSICVQLCPRLRANRWTTMVNAPRKGAIDSFRTMYLSPALRLYIAIGWIQKSTFHMHK